MNIGKLNLLMGGFLALVGLGLAAAGPAAMPAFGVETMPPAGGGTTDVPAEWRLVAFSRLFGASVFLLGAILVAIGDQLGAGQTRLFAGLVAGSSALVFVLAVVQQTAIWNTVGGAVVAAVFAVLAMAYGWMAMGGEAATASASSHS